MSMQMSKANAKRLAILGGMAVALAGLMSACGTGNNVVPQVQMPGGTPGQCPYGVNYFPGAQTAGYGYYGGGYGYPSYPNPYPQAAAGCAAGYVFSGGQCVCNSNYMPNGGCPVGYIYYGSRCVYSSGTYGGGYGTCPPGMIYDRYYGCRY